MFSRIIWCKLKRFENKRVDILTSVTKSPWKSKENENVGFIELKNEI